MRFLKSIAELIQTGVYHMSPGLEFKPPNERDYLGRFLAGQLPLEKETCLFILVNVLDFFMTYILLTTGAFRESNAVAAYFWNHWGPRGMLYFKLGLVLFVCLISQLIALKSHAKARFVLNLGTIVVSCVVVYSLMIYLRAQ